MPSTASRPTPSARWSRKTRRKCRPIRRRSKTRGRRSATRRSSRRSTAAPASAWSTRATSSTRRAHPASSSSPRSSRSPWYSVCRSRTSTQINNAFAKGPLPVDALRSDNNAVIDHGQLTVLDNQVDQSTGTVKLKAEFPNADVQLWPGQFVNVRLLIDTLKQVVVIPTGAVQRGPSGTFVYVVGDDDVAKIQPVTVTKQDETTVGHRRRRDAAATRGDHRLCPPDRWRQGRDRQRAEGTPAPARASAARARAASAAATARAQSTSTGARPNPPQ